MSEPNTLMRLMRAWELAGDRRAGSFARTRARRAQLEFLREQWRWLLVAWLILVSPSVVLWWVLSSDVVRGALVGASLVGASMVIWSLIVQTTGTAPFMMGDQAEQWTAQALRKVRHGWRLVNHFTLGHGDLDHVAIGPAGVIAVETKWSAHPWASAEGNRRQHQAVAQVRRASRRLALWHGVKSTGVPVRPVVVLWGGGARKWPEEDRVREIDGVSVVVGYALRDWMRGLEAHEGCQAASGRIWDALESHARKREEREPELTDVPPSLGDILARLAWFVGAATIAFLAVAEVVAATESTLWSLLVGTGIAAGACLVRRRAWVRAAATGAVLGASVPTGVLAIAAVVSLLV